MWNENDIRWLWKSRQVMLAFPSLKNGVISIRRMLLIIKTIKDTEVLEAYVKRQPYPNEEKNKGVQKSMLAQTSSFIGTASGSYASHEMQSNNNNNS